MGMIPAQAVEAAAKAIEDRMGGPVRLQDLSRIALEAAAPYLRAELAESRDGDLFRFTWAQREWLRGGGE